MATLNEKSIKITRNFSTLNPNQANFVYDDTLKEGDLFDLVQFQINELDEPFYWRVSIGVVPNTSEKEVKETIEEYVKQIEEKDIKAYNDFLNFGNKWGWD